MTLHEEYKAQLKEAGDIEAENWEAVKKPGCSACHYNIGNTWPEASLPCGQQHCWYELEEA